VKGQEKPIKTDIPPPPHKSTAPDAKDRMFLCGKFC
jgi:hypothetical protein